MNTEHALKDFLLFEDDNYLVMDKPTGMASIPERNPNAAPSLKEMIQAYYEDIFVVHRIDKDTSGAICFAKNAGAHAYLSQLFENRKVNKTYYAVTKGVVRPADGTIDAAIGEDTRLLHRMRVDTKNGKASVTDYTTIKAFKHYTWLSVHPLTGRTHQIRVHMAHLGYPLAVDPLYGSADPITIMDIKRRARLGKYVETATPIISRLTLHASKLEFLSIDGTSISAEAPMPNDMAVLIKQLEKWNSN